MVLEELLNECEAKANEAIAVAGKATSGPWISHHYGPSDCRVRLDIVGHNEPVIFLDDRAYDPQTIGGCGANVQNADDDARFIAHARTSTPDLAARVLVLVKMVREREESSALDELRSDRAKLEDVVEAMHVAWPDDREFRGSLAEWIMALGKERDALRAEVAELRPDTNAWRGSGMNESMRELIENCEQHLQSGQDDEGATMALAGRAPALIDAIREQATEIEKLRPDAEAWRKGVKVLDELRARIIPCGHTIGDLIGGEGSVTKCGACLASVREHRAKLATRLMAAIRRQTVDVDNGNKPNGPFEQAIETIANAIEPRQFYRNPDGARKAVGSAMAAMCKAFAADNKELCEAASEYFGEDFNKP
jgi:hypothetical protein